MTTPGTFWKLARFGSMKLNLLLGTLFVLLIVFSIITLVLYGVLFAVCLIGGGVFALLVFWLISRARSAAGNAIENTGGD